MFRTVRLAQMSSSSTLIRCIIVVAARDDTDDADARARCSLVGLAPNRRAAIPTLWLDAVFTIPAPPFLVGSQDYVLANGGGERIRVLRVLTV